MVLLGLKYPFNNQLLYDNQQGRLGLNCGRQDHSCYEQPLYGKIKLQSM